MSTATKIEFWKTQETKRYLASKFLDGRIDDYPKGGARAHLFLVTQQQIGQRYQVAHQLLITRQFFDRYLDHHALRDALTTLDVVGSLKEAGDRTVELY